MRKIKLINNISSLYKMQYTIDDTSVYMKRDDTLDFAFGGNKVRLFEYIAAVINEKKVRRIVTYGSIYSNYVRVAAAVCAKLGVECDIIILEKNTSKDVIGGNASLLSFYEVNIIKCPLENAYDFIDNYQKELKDKGINFLWIPGGGHMPEAAWGYLEATNEILEQADKLNIKFDACFLPCGTGTTQAGIICGFENSNIDVYGVTIARDEKRCKKVIGELITKMQQLEPTISVPEDSINVLDNGNIKYGDINEGIKELMKEVATTDGIFLDPIYNAKAFWRMKTYLKENPRYKNVLYINTGGSPNVFMRGCNFEG